MEIREMAKIAYDALDDKKGVDITVLDISEISTMADYFIIASGNNDNIIVHVFNKDNRLFYDLERIWRDGKVVEL